MGQFGPLCSTVHCNQEVFISAQPQACFTKKCLFPGAERDAETDAIDDVIMPRVPEDVLPPMHVSRDRPVPDLMPNSQTLSCTAKTGLPSTTVKEGSPR